MILDRSARDSPAVITNAGHVLGRPHFQLQFFMFISQPSEALERPPGIVLLTAPSLRSVRATYFDTRQGSVRKVIDALERCLFEMIKETITREGE